MISIFNFSINLLIVVCLFIYFIFTTIGFNLENIEYFLILIIVINSFNKIYIWSNFRVFIKKDLNKIFKDILFNDSFAKLSIVILSTVIPIYMLMQKDMLQKKRALKLLGIWHMALHSLAPELSKLN